MNPLVSVIVPMYNASGTIVETLDSIQASTYRPIEVVVVDDGSTDDSLQIVQTFAESFSQTDTTISLTILSQTNRGVSAARNHAIRAAQGEYILPVDADDKISATYIDHAVAAMRPDVRVVSCRAQFFGAKSGEWKLPPFSHERLARKNMIHVSSLFRRADWDRVGGYSEEDIYREDWDFWLSLFELGGEYVLLDETGLYYRIQDGSRRKTAQQHKRAIVDAVNRRHPAYMQRYLGGKLHYHRSWSKLLNRISSVRQAGTFDRWNEGVTIDARRNILRRTNGMIVKHFAVPNIWRGLWYGLIGKSKARRSYENALRMAGLTPEPIAYREERVAGILRESAYVCRESECGYTFNDLIGHPDFPNRKTILEAVGRFTATLHQRGILHRDYSAGNILFTADGKRVEVIDLNRIRIRRHLSRRARLMNFERLNIDHEALRVMAYAYADAMNEDREEDAAFIIRHRWRKHRKNTPQNAV